MKTAKAKNRPTASVATTPRAEDEVTPDLEPQVAELVKQVKLRDVRMVETKAQLHMDSFSSDVEGNLQLLVEPSQTRAGVSGTVLYCGVRLGVKVAAAEEKHIVTEVSAEYGLFYDLPEDYSVAPEVANVFAGRNGLFNAWPFFRELVHSMISRMGFPGLVITSFTLSPTPLKTI